MTQIRLLLDTTTDNERLVFERSLSCSVERLTLSTALQLSATGPSGCRSIQTNIYFNRPVTWRAKETLSQQKSLLRLAGNVSHLCSRIRDFYLRARGEDISGSNRCHWWMFKTMGYFPWAQSRTLWEQWTQCFVFFISWFVWSEESWRRSNCLIWLKNNYTGGASPLEHW